MISYLGEEIGLLFKIKIPTNIKGVSWKLHYEPQLMQPIDINPTITGIQFEVSQSGMDIDPANMMPPKIELLENGVIGFAYGIDPQKPLIGEGIKSMFSLWFKLIELGDASIDYSELEMIDANNENVVVKENGGMVMTIEGMVEGELIINIIKRPSV